MYPFGAIVMNEKHYSGVGSFMLLLVVVVAIAMGSRHNQDSLFVMNCPTLELERAVHFWARTFELGPYIFFKLWPRPVPDLCDFLII